jgi:MFS family permease
VLVVVASIELLGLAEPGVGGLNASMGLGGLIGAAIAIALAGRPRLAPPFAIALASWGAPIAVIGLLADPLAAIVAMAVVGMSNAVLDVAGFTLLQRTTPRDARVAVLGLVDGVANGAVAVGGIVAPVLVEMLGIRGALVVSGAILPIAAAVMWPGLRRVDEDAVDAGPAVDRFRGVPMFAPLPLATVEYLATSAEPAAFADGQWLMREGERGDRYYLLEAGQAEVSQGGRQVRVVGPGEGVGEIALLRDIPRTASVRAAGPVLAYALERDDFLQAITGQPASLTAATTLVDDRLATDPRRAADATHPPAGDGADLH